MIRRPACHPRPGAQPNMQQPSLHLCLQVAPPPPKRAAKPGKDEDEEEAPKKGGGFFGFLASKPVQVGGVAGRAGVVGGGAK